MKKLLIVAAIGLAAFCSQASMVYWSFASSAANNATKDPPWTYFDTAQDLNGVTAYLLTASDWDSSDVAGSLAKKQASAESSTWSKHSYDTTKQQAAFQTGKLQATGLSLATGTGDFYIIVSDGNQYWASSKIEGVSILADGDTTPTYTTAAVSLTNATALTPASFTAVPEPTSGLLMLLGVAGLALRRRRA